MSKAVKIGASSNSTLSELSFKLDEFNVGRDSRDFSYVEKFIISVPIGTHYVLMYVHMYVN